MVPSTATCPRDGSFVLAFSGNRKIVDFPTASSMASQRILEVCLAIAVI
jgi:hypothetical protein